MNHSDAKKLKLQNDKRLDRLITENRKMFKVENFCKKKKLRRPNNNHFRRDPHTTSSHTSPRLLNQQTQRKSCGNRQYLMSRYTSIGLDSSLVQTCYQRAAAYLDGGNSYTHTPDMQTVS